jgi:hypothetical protein
MMNFLSINFTPFIQFRVRFICCRAGKKKRSHFRSSFMRRLAGVRGGRILPVDSGGDPELAGTAFQSAAGISASRICERIFRSTPPNCKPPPASNPQRLLEELQRFLRRQRGDFGLPEALDVPGYYEIRADPLRAGRLQGVLEIGHGAGESRFHAAFQRIGGVQERLHGFADASRVNALAEDVRHVVDGNRSCERRYAFASTESRLNPKTGISRRGRIILKKWANIMGRAVVGDDYFKFIGIVPTVYYIIYQSKEHEILAEKFKS